MKNNTSNTKNLLIQALDNLPQDFALRETRSAIRLALHKLEKVEGRRIQRENDRVRQEEMQKNKKKAVDGGLNDAHLFWQFENPEVAANVIKNLDKMIGEEKTKLDKKRLDKLDSELQNILG